MTTWNHRVFRKVVRGPREHWDPCTVWSIRETFYNEKGKVEGWSTDSLAPESFDEEGVEGLRQELLMMLKACDKPALEDEDDGR